MALPRPLAAAGALARAGLRPERPDRLPRAMLAMAAWGPTMAGGIAAASARYPTAPAVIDDEGTVTFADLWFGTDGIARGLKRRGVGPGSSIGILARNGRVFVQSVVAAAKLGADVVAHEGVDTVLHDDGFAPLVAEVPAVTAVSGSELATLAMDRSLLPFPPTRRVGRQVILTSGTTGRPKGAARGSVSGIDSLTPLLEVVPIRARSTVVIAAPLFHAWGLVHMGVGLGMSSTAVLQSQFDPEATLAAIAEHRADGLAVVPVMLQRILALGGPTLARYDTSSLRYIASSGSALGATLATAVIRRFGPILYNIYGSTEVSLATIAGPGDLQSAPATAGRVAPGSTVRILDHSGNPVGPGVVGRVFVGSGARFDGYTGGGGKEQIDGLLSSGDLGHFDEHGRLFIDGRDDDMIVSGGENVFPAEVEDLLAGHDAIVEVAVFGVDDEKFGQRLKAVVVTRGGSDVSADELKEFVKSNLAGYKVPRDVEFIDELPRNATGKVLKRELKGEGDEDEAEGDKAEK
ncbi:MAG TPA: AMP-binding protein [Ilumatobacteraceae bacterium]|nr:AMP-binding protein [Ilumatobacteraceae bacterium]